MFVKLFFVRVGCFDLDLINYTSTLDFTKLSFKAISDVYVQEKPVDQPIHHVVNFPSL